MRSARQGESGVNLELCQSGLGVALCGADRRRREPFGRGRGDHLSVAYADGMAAGGCIGGGSSLNCIVRWGEARDPYIRTVPPAADEIERTHAAERDRKWEARCKPTIAQDRYGVPRYQYAAPGCEFGVIQ